jgi:DNA-binding NtrC family response regulator
MGKIVTEPFDLVVTDLCIPDIGGLEIIQHLHQVSPQANAILITAYGGDKVEAEVRRLGICGYLTKPFDMEDFARAVREALLPAEGG